MWLNNSQAAYFRGFTLFNFLIEHGVLIFRRPPKKLY